VECYHNPNLLGCLPATREIDLGVRMGMLEQELTRVAPAEY